MGTVSFLTTQQPFYLPGEAVYFVIYVTNPQDWPVPQPHDVGWDIEMNGVAIDSEGVSIDFGPDIPTFPAHSRTLCTRTLWWDQKTGSGGNLTQVQPGNYTANISIRGYGYDSSDSCIIEIRPAS